MSEANMTEDKRSMRQFAGVAGNRHYNDLDGFRAIAAIAIVVMHVHVRGEYVHTSTWLSTAVEPLGTFVTLFFIISGFGMCCGYYDRVKNGSMDIERFYSRRIAKILPFFALLVCIDVVTEGFSPNALWEAFADVTLMFNLLPDLNIHLPIHVLRRWWIVVPVQASHRILEQCWAETGSSCCCGGAAVVVCRCACMGIQCQAIGVMDSVDGLRHS